MTNKNSTLVVVYVKKNTATTRHASVKQCQWYVANLAAIFYFLKEKFNDFQLSSFPEIVFEKREINLICYSNENNIPEGKKKVELFCSWKGSITLLKLAWSPEKNQVSFPIDNGKQKTNKRNFLTSQSDKKLKMTRFYALKSAHRWFTDF